MPFISSYLSYLVSSSLFFCLFTSLLYPVCAFWLSLRVWVCIGKVGDWEDSPFSFVFISLIYFCSQMWADRHHSVAPFPFSLPACLPSAPLSPPPPPYPTLLLGGQASTPHPPLSITEDGCVFKAEIDCGYQSYGAIHHGRYYSDERDWTRRWDSRAHGWVLGGQHEV